MIPGYTTWEDVGSIDDNVLLIVNSRRDEEAEVAIVYRELEARAPRTLHLIAEASWRGWIFEHGVDATRVLFASDDQGNDIELYHFLETSIAIRWIGPKQFRLVAGTAAHSLYNEEVKDLFEQRVGVFLGDGYLLAHALPERGLYVFDLAALAHRLGREPRRHVYQARCRALIDDLHLVWREQGSPGVADGPDRTDVDQVLSRHLGAAVITFDERSAIPLNRGDHTDETDARMLSHLLDVIRERDQTILERDEAICIRNEMLAERNQAVTIRDAIIDELRLALETPTTRLRRWLSGIVKQR